MRSAMKLATNHLELDVISTAHVADFSSLSKQSQPQPDPVPYISSAGDISPKSLAARGGNRLSASRQSEYLSHEAAQTFMEAAGLTQSLGMPFTRFVTINWGLAGLRDSEAAKATGRLIKLLTDWGRKRGERVLWAWVRENGPGEETHVHILIACPAKLPIARMWRRWIKGITGKPYVAGAVLTRTIGRRLDAPISNPTLFRCNLFRTAAYCCKGVHPAHQFLLGDRSTKYAGWITGKRSAVCQHLLAELRKRQRL